MQEGIERARAELVAVPAQFLDHGQAIDRLLHSVVQHMKPDEPRVEIAMIGILPYFGVLVRHVHSPDAPENISIFDIAYRAIGTSSRNVRALGNHIRLRLAQIS